MITYDVIGLVETNLSPDLVDSELGFKGYNIYRCDRSMQTSNKACGGGSLIAVHNSFPSCVVSPTTTNTESVFVKCTGLSTNIIIGCTYIPPSQNSTVYSDYCHVVDEVVGLCSESDGLLLMGDFNLPDTDWINCSSATSDSSQYILDMAAFHGLRQVNSISNYRNVILDLVFSSIMDTEVESSVDLLLPEDKHHPALDIILKTNQPRSSHSARYIPNYRECNVEEIFRHIQGWSIPTSSEIQQADDFFSTFSRRLSLLISQHTPMKKIGNSNFPKWFSSELKNAVIQKKIYHKRYRISGSPLDFECFRIMRRRCKILTSKCHKDYMTKIEDAIPHNIKSFWTHVNNLKGSNTLPPKMILNESEACDPGSKCDLFARHFSSVFCHSDIVVPSFDYGCNGSLSSVRVCATEVQTKLEALDPNKSPGPDNIPSRILRFCAPVLAAHLAVLFNVSLDAGVFPSILKQGYVVPIFKSGDRSNIKNYRPIVIQSSIAKVFESLVLDRLYFFLKPYISDRQHGFLCGRSTITNLLLFNEYIMSAFVDSSQVDCIYLDFSKAFDRVHHDLLIAKLAGYGVGGQLLGWLDSYLRCRKLMIKCDGSISAPFSVLSGVPQGSHLGPLMFNAFINDINSVITSNCLMFADDLKIFSRVLSTADQERLQQSLSAINVWCKANAMELNVTKCNIMSFSRSVFPFIYDYQSEGIKLDRVKHVRDLGVILTSALSPLDHITEVTSRAYSLLGFVCRTTRHFRTVEPLLVLYRALVRPVLEYGSVIWSPFQLGHVVLINRVQVRFTKILGARLGYSFQDAPICELQHNFQLYPLHLRRKIFDLLFLYKLVNGVLDCPELLMRIEFHIPRGTRSRTIFGRSFRPTGYAYNNGLVRIQRFGSDYATRVDFFIDSLQSFKRSITADVVLEWLT